MLFRIDPTAPEPIFEQLVSQVRLAILNGDIGAGERLPSARELAAALEVNLHTVLHAYQELRDVGLVELRRGRGATVAAGALAIPQAVQDDIDRLCRDAQEASISAETLIVLIKEAMK